MEDPNLNPFHLARYSSHSVTHCHPLQLPAVTHAHMHARSTVKQPKRSGRCQPCMFRKLYKAACFPNALAIGWSISLRTCLLDTTSPLR